jgi:NTP pyrophosphatase (non-canonical NTP hydrolase)
VELAAAQREVETISRVYARLHGIERTDDWLVLKLGEEVGELTRAYLAWSGRSRHDASSDERAAALRDEVADVLAHLLLVAERTGVDLDDALERKWFRWRHLIEEQDRDAAAEAAP